MGVITWGVGAEPPAAGGEASRGLGAESPTPRRFFQFFPKNKAFSSIFWYK